MSKTGTEELILVIFKPDAVVMMNQARHPFWVEIFGYFKDLDLNLVALKMVPAATREQLSEHYKLSDYSAIRKGRWILRNSGYQGEPSKEEARKAAEKLMAENIEYGLAGPNIISVWQGISAFSKIAAIVGDRDPSKAEAGTIRGDLGQDSMFNVQQRNFLRSLVNLISYSDSEEEALAKIPIWFQDNEILSLNSLANSRHFFKNLFDGNFGLTQHPHGG